MSGIQNLPCSSSPTDDTQKAVEVAGEKTQETLKRFSKNLENQIEGFLMKFENHYLRQNETTREIIREFLSTLGSKNHQSMAASLSASLPQFIQRLGISQQTSFQQLTTHLVQEVARSVNEARQRQDPAELGPNIEKTIQQGIERVLPRYVPQNLAQILQQLAFESRRWRQWTLNLGRDKKHRIQLCILHQSAETLGMLEMTDWELADCRHIEPGESRELDWDIMSAVDELARKAGNSPCARLEKTLALFQKVFGVSLEDAKSLGQKDKRLEQLLLGRAKLMSRKFDTKDAQPEQLALMQRAEEEDRQLISNVDRVLSDVGKYGLDPGLKGMEECNQLNAMLSQASYRRAVPARHFVESLLDIKQKSLESSSAEKNASTTETNVSTAKNNAKA